MKVVVIIFFLIFWSLYPFSMAHSAIILKIKGRKALVDLEGQTAEKGDKFDALNIYGKPLGVLQIRKIKKGKAIATLIKGKMGINWILEPSAPGSSSYFEEGDEYDPAGRGNESGATHFSTGSSFQKSPYSSNGVGLILGSQYNMIATAQNKSVVGWSLSEQLIVDFNIMGPLASRIMVGHQNLRAKGANCGLSNCNLDIHYIGAGFLLRGVFLRHSMFQPWVGAGGFLLWPLIVNPKANLGLDKKSFSSFHGALTGALGVDIHLGGFYIPIQIDASWVNPVLISFKPLKQGAKEFKPLYVGAKAGISFAF